MAGDTELIFLYPVSSKLFGSPVGYPRSTLAEITPTTSLVLEEVTETSKNQTQSLIHNIIRGYTQLLDVILYILDTNI